MEKKLYKEKESDPELNINQRVVILIKAKMIPISLDYDHISHEVNFRNILNI